MSAPDKAAKHMVAGINDVPNVLYEWAPETDRRPLPHRGLGHIGRPAEPLRE